MDKILLLDKPRDISSAGILNKIKKKLNIGSLGHAGTLDPFATGLLIVACGRATKVLSYFQSMPKKYITKIKFGILTDTDDITGNILQQEQSHITLKEIQKIIPNFIGEITQIPPKYSALKIDGERAYKLARNNIDFEIPSRKVQVLNIEIIQFLEEKQELEIAVSCSTGTYIRSLGRDIALALGTVGTLTELERNAIGIFSINNAFVFKDLTQESFKDIDSMLDFLPKLKVKQEFLSLVNNGASIKNHFLHNTGSQEGYSPSYYLLYSESLDFLGVVDNRSLHFMYKVL